MFQKCFVSTADTTTKLLENGETYVFTGDIEAMWLRDSSAQVVHYLPFAKEFLQIRHMIAGLIQRQMRYITIDPYANAFNEEENGHCWEKDDTESNDWEWERKYEVDSLCYPLWLLNSYYEATGDETVFSPEVKKAFRRILDTWKTEQHHDNESSYYFRRINCPPTDTLSNDGKGEPTAYTGMTWSGFRPSDDACRYGYLVPSNMFASVVLGYLAEYAADKFHDEEMAQEALTLKKRLKWVLIPMQYVILMVLEKHTFTRQMDMAMMFGWMMQTCRICCLCHGLAGAMQAMSAIRIQESGY